MADRPSPDRRSRKITASTSDLLRGMKRRSKRDERRAAKASSSPGRAMAELEKLETKDEDPVEDTVAYWPAHRGRVTGFFVGCYEHGPMPVLAPNADAAYTAADTHRRTEHGGRGRVVRRPREPGTRSSRSSSRKG